MYLLCASGFIINSKNQFLMIRRADTMKFLPSHWELPGGIIEDGEDPVLGIQRETKEESGLDIKALYPLKVVCYFENVENPRESYGIIYSCKLESENQKVILSHEHSDYKWVDFNGDYPVPLSNFAISNIEEYKKHPLVNLN